MIKVEVFGNVGGDPELKQTKAGGDMVRFTVASTKKQDGREPVTSWVTVLAFKEQAQQVAEKVKKGDRVIVTGTLTVEKYSDKDGNERTAVTVMADEIGVSLRWPPRGQGSAKAESESSSEDWGGF